MVAPLVSAELNERQVALLNQRLERFARSISDLTPANREASIALYGWTIRNFDRQGGLQGGWAPLAPSTIRQKQRIGKQVPLVRTGALRANFTSFFSRDNAGVGNQLGYSRFQHEGTATIPSRELLPRRETVLEIGIRVYDQYVRRQVREANGGA